MAKRQVSESTIYTISGKTTNNAGELLPGLTVRAFDQDPSGENPLGKATTDHQGNYQITYSNTNFRIGGKESGGPDIIVRVYAGEQLLAETEPKRNAGKKAEINIKVDWAAEPLLTPEMGKRLGALLLAFKDKKDLEDKFNHAFIEAKGDWAAARTQIGGAQSGFDEEALQHLDFTHHLAELTGDHIPLIEAFHANDKTNSLNDIAKLFDRTQFTDLVISKGVPEGQKADSFAGTVYNNLFHAAPTAMLSRMISVPAESPIADKALSGNVVTFLSNLPETFNIKTTSIYEVFKQEDVFKGIAPELQEGVITQLKTLQRVAALSPVPEAMPVLMKANLTSALRISDMPEGQFVQVLAQAWGEQGDIIARQIHVNAVNARIRNEHALMALTELGRGTGVAMIDKPLYAQKALATATRSAQPGIFDATALLIPSKYLMEKHLPQHNLSWDLLFDDADFCECGECNSVYSPAAYFVDLLQYLRNNNLDDQTRNPDGTLKYVIKKGYDNTPLEKLFIRRPDLGCLQLTCKNAFTVLPYIDLVNEIMENYIVPPHELKPFNVEEDETSGELLAQPQHTEYQAYCILHKTEFPFTLPYHQPIDAARIFLDYLGTSRYELIDKYRSPRKEKIDPANETEPDNSAPGTHTEAEKKELDDLHEAYLERAADAEYLGLTQEEYIILTQEAFVSKEYWDKQCKKEHTTEEYRTKIGWKTTHEYYGYDKDKEQDMLSADETNKPGLTFVKNQFLRRTGIEYTDLVELLKTRCLNPNMPKGKALSIMQSLQFSYRYLQQSLVVRNAGTPKGKYEKVVDFLIKAQPWVSSIEPALNPDPCNLQKPDACVETKELEQWVYCYFERIGQIIVLESGEKPVLPIFGDLYVSNVSPTHGFSSQEKVGALAKDGKIFDINGQEIGEVKFDGKAYDSKGEILKNIVKT